MPEVTRVAGLTSTLDASSGQYAPQIYDYAAGEAIETGMPVYLKASDLKLYKASGAAAGEAANVLGFAGRTVKPNMRLTAFGKGARFGGFGGLTPGTKLYLGATPGSLDTAPTTAGTTPIAVVATTTDVIAGGVL